MKKIILMRHGKVVADVSKRVSPREFPEWVKTYDNSGVDQDIPPGCSTLNMIKKNRAVVCSGLKRSHDSVLLCNKQPLEANPLFNEAGMPASSMPLPKLSPKMWAIFYRTIWMMGYSDNSESHTEAKERAGHAADRLIDLSQEHGSVLLIGHGVMNRLIAKKLKHKGWQVKKRLKNDHWDYGIFEKKD